MPPSKSSSPNQTLRETDYANLRRQILSGQVAPGARLVKASLPAEPKAGNILKALAKRDSRKVRLATEDHIQSAGGESFDGFSERALFLI